MPLLFACLSGVCLSGCGLSNSSERYIPNEPVARLALTKALTAWQQGSLGTSLPLDETIAIEVVDKQRREGQMLVDFKILGDVSVDGGRWFEVQLKLDNPRQTEQVRYVVVGINPLWVFRQYDYEMLGHWDHPMPENAPGQPEKTASPADDRANG
jgi:hypothetical protein